MEFPTSTPLARFLARLQQRSCLGEEERAAILSLKGHIQKHQPRTEIVSFGQTVDHSCLVVRGLVGRFDQMRDGLRQITSFYIPGDMCDLHSAVAPKANWSITSVGPTTILHVPHHQLRDLAARYPSIATAFWRDAVVDASIFAKWVGNLGRKHAVGRLAHIICEMGLRIEYARLGCRTSFEFPATQEQLADAAGLTPVHINRTLQELRRRELLTYRSGHVEILDWDGLADMADFSPDYLMFQTAAPAPTTEWLVRPVSGLTAH